MSEQVIFKGGETSDLIEEFNERKKYQEWEGFKKYRTIDTLFERFNYGILNKNYQPVTPVVNNIEQDLQNFPDFAQDVYVLPFVAKAFEDFRKDYVDFIENGPETIQQAISLGYLESQTEFLYGLLAYPTHLQDVAPIRGYINYEEEYTNYINFNLIEYMTLMADSVSSEDISNLNERIGPVFRQFMDKFMALYQERARKFPLTKSGFSTSHHCSIMTTGLCLELADLDYNLDGPKGEIVGTPAFECFADFANYYGFFIDKNAPWRLIADLESEAMKKYIVAGHPVEPENAIEYFNTYARTLNHLDDIYSLDVFVTRLFVSLYGTPSQVALITSEEFRDRKYWISILLQSRFMELGIPLDNNYDTTKQIVLDTLDNFGLRYTIQHIGMLSSQKLKEIYGPDDTANP